MAQYKRTQTKEGKRRGVYISPYKMQGSYPVQICQEHASLVMSAVRSTHSRVVSRSGGDEQQCGPRLGRSFQQCIHFVYKVLCVVMFRVQLCKGLCYGRFCYGRLSSKLCRLKINKYIFTILQDTCFISYTQL